RETAKLGQLPVVNFAAGGVATPADAALMMLLGSDGVFVGSGIFKSKNPEEFAKAIVEATANYDKPELVASASKGLGEAMKGLEISEIADADRMQDRGL
ncbi:MAG: pyridoxal 5'-phosphate synthase lyase subunit PdxS, partial [Methanobacteriaceae archaeon]